MFGCVLPFAMVDEMGWFAIPIVSLVSFTLYGIEGIGSQLEDPFGYDRNDIKMDALVGDSKMEIDVVLDEWRKYSKTMDRMRSAKEGSGHGERCLDANMNVGESEAPSEQEYMPPDLFLKLRPRTAN